MTHRWILIRSYLFERKKQTLLAILGVAFGVAAYISMSSMMNGFQKNFIEQVIDINAHITVKVREEPRAAKILDLVYPGELFEILGSKPPLKRDKILNSNWILQNYQRHDEIIGVAPHLVGQVIISFANLQRSATLIGIDPVFEPRASLIEKFLQYGALNVLLTNRTGIILGRLLAQDLGIDFPGKKITLTFPNGKSELFTVVDIFNSGITALDQARAYVNIRTYQALSERLNEVNEIIFRIKDVDMAEALSKKIQQESGYYAESWQKAYQNFLTIFKIQNYTIYMIVGAILIVSAFGIFNITMMLIVEKKKDIAILTALGFSTRDIQFIFSKLGLIIGILGSAVGCLFGFLIQEWLESFEFDVEGLVRAKGFVLDRWHGYYWLGAVFGTILSSIAGVYPAKKAASLNPVEIFRSG